MSIESIKSIKRDIYDNEENKNEENKNDEDEDKDEYVIGIDLGTRFSCVSVWRNKKFEIICDQFGNRTIPSMIAFYKSAKLVGHNALAMKDINPLNTINDIKRIIGRRIDDPMIEQIKKLLPYEIIDDESTYHNILVQLDKSDSSLTHKKIYRPEEICAHILIEIKRMASTYLGRPITQAVITVPARFNDAQRQATLDAAKIAGLDVLKIINEPTAAALAYGLGSRKWANKGGNVLIYDLGAGTLDISLMNINNGNFRVLSVDGNIHLGGEDIDYLIMNHVMIAFKKQHKIRELKISKLSQVKLKNSVENAKKILSSTDKAVICVDDFCNNRKLYHVLTREIFEMISNEFFIMCVKPLNSILKSAKMSKTDIDEIILVGGSTRIPKIQSLILDFFSNTKIKYLNKSLNPDEVVSAGASIYGYIITHKDDPFSKNLVLFDITPLSLGVETLQNQMTVIIPRNTTIPTKKIKVFSTDTDDQDNVQIKIFEGERKLTKNNFHVGTFELTGFEKGPRGYPTIRITFHIDINGILQVTALEKRSDVQNTIQITSTWGAKGRLSKNEIDQIINDAEKHEEIDTMYSLKIGLVHQINTMCNMILTNLSNDEYKLTAADKRKIRIDIKNNIKWLKDNELVDLSIIELEKREKRISKTYIPFITQINKKNDHFSDCNKNIACADIYGDDNDTKNNDYEEIQIHDDPTEYDKEEIKAIKKTIQDLGKNILSVVKNPISRFSEDDIVTITDYMDSVNIWLYVTSASTTIEYVAKINEINKFTEEIMKKYSNVKVFEQNDKFTTKDELQLTCLTLNTSIKNNYFSLEKKDTEKMLKKINDTMIWLISHQNEPEQFYRDKLHEISDLCNVIYHSLHRMKILDQIVDSDDDDIQPENIEQPIQEKNKISEKIDRLIDQLPNKLIKKNNAPHSNNSDNKDILIKIDFNKLKSNTVIRYKNVDQYCR